MSVQIQSVDMYDERVHKTMIEQFYNKIARDKIKFLLDRGGVLELVDEEVATIKCDNGVAEVCIYGSVRWIA